MLASSRLGEADLLRRAMGKKDAEGDGEAARSLYERRGGAGHPKAAVEEIFEQMAKFSGVRIQQVALGGVCAGGLPDGVSEDPLPGGVHGRAAHFGNLEAGQRGEVHRRVPEMGISVEPPDVQVSGAQFTPHGEAAIRFGLAAVKNVGGNAIESILKARAEVGGRFKSFWEFCEKVDLRVMNKRVIESLIKAGALDSLGTRGAADRRGRQGDGARAEGAERCGAGADAASSGSSTKRPRTAARRRRPAARRRLGRERAAGQRERSAGILCLRPSAGQVRRKAAQPARRDSDRRSAGTQAAGAALGQAVGPGRRDSGGGHHPRPARAEEPARSEALCAGLARRCDRQDRSDLLCARLRAARRAVEDRSAGAGARHAHGR